MAVSGKTAAPIEAPYALSTDKPPDVPALSKAMADRQHALLNGFALSNLAHGTAGQLIVVQSTGAAAYKALKGDATIAEDGTLTLSANSVGASEITDGSVGTAELANLAVAEGKVADAAITSRKLKPTTGVVYGTEGSDLTCGNSYADVPGASLPITPMVASILRVTAVIRRKTGTGPVAASLKVDSETELSPFALIPEGVAGGFAEGSAVQVYEIPLTAAAHTIKLRAEKADPTKAATVWSAQSGFSYELRAS